MFRTQKISGINLLFYKNQVTQNAEQLEMIINWLSIEFFKEFIKFYLTTLMTSHLPLHRYIVHTDKYR